MITLVKTQSKINVWREGDIIAQFTTSAKIKPYAGDSVLIQDETDKFIFEYSDLDKANCNPVVVATNPTAFVVESITSFFPNASAGGDAGGGENAESLDSLALWGYKFDKNYIIRNNVTGNFDAPDLTNAIDQAQTIVYHNDVVQPSFLSSKYVRGEGYFYVTGVLNIIILQYNQVSDRIEVYRTTLEQLISAVSGLTFPYATNIVTGSNPTAFVFKSNVVGSIDTSENPTYRWLKSANSGGTSPTVQGTSSTYTLIGDEGFIGVGITSNSDGFQGDEVILSPFQLVKNAENTTKTAQTKSYTNGTGLTKSNGDGFTGSYEEIKANTSGAVSLGITWAGGAGLAGIQSNEMYEAVFNVKIQGLSSNAGNAQGFVAAGNVDQLFIKNTELPVFPSTTSQTINWNDQLIYDTVFEVRCVFKDFSVVNGSFAVRWVGGTLVSGITKLFVQPVRFQRIIG
jgi:hypothetical protein